jgi:hypothetical protein
MNWVKYAITFLVRSKIGAKYKETITHDKQGVNIGMLDLDSFEDISQLSRMKPCCSGVEVLHLPPSQGTELVSGTVFLSGNK